MTNLKNNFFAKAWRGEEKFWKVCLIGVVEIILLLILVSIWNARIPMLMCSIGIGLLLIPLKRCKKNITIVQESSILSAIINLIIFLFFTICILLVLFFLFSFVVTGMACEARNGEFCRNLF